MTKINEYCAFSESVLSIVGSDLVVFVIVVTLANGELVKSTFFSS